MVVRSRSALRRLLPGTLALLVAVLPVLARAVAADWPTYGHDIGRSGTTSETVRVPLVRAWRVRSPSRPVPAWDEPATWDGWNRVMQLRNRVEFDKAFQVAAVGDVVYYGSSVDDKVYCLDAATGETRWAFFAEGPIRLAPTVAHQRVYFGSDDGCVYCLEADDGTLVWKQRLAPRDRRLPGSGRMISLWPVRTGVTVDGEAVYCGAGVLPSEKIYLGALAAGDGSLIWRTPLDDLPLQGYPLVSNRYLFVATGRGGPVVFDRRDGKRLYRVGDGRGTFALLSGETVFLNAGRNAREIVAATGQSEEQLAFFPGQHLIASDRALYLHNQGHLAALDRPAYLGHARQRHRLEVQKKQLAKELRQKKETFAAAEISRRERALAGIEVQLKQQTRALQDCFRWQIDCPEIFTMALANGTLLVGGAGRVAALETQTGQSVWEAPADGRVYGLAIAQGRLFVSTDTGTIDCFVPAPGSAVADAVADSENLP